MRLADMREGFLCELGKLIVERLGDPKEGRQQKMTLAIPFAIMRAVARSRLALLLAALWRLRLLRWRMTVWLWWRTQVVYRLHRWREP